MVRILEILGVVILVIFAVASVLLVASIIIHRCKVRKEGREYLPPGNVVAVNDKRFHLYAEGEGDITLVFMAGHGTTNPTLDFKPLWMRMTDEYRIAVVERSGYGWSETSNSPRDIDTILEETRKVLEVSGAKAPYILFPHSMSGLEAIHWTQEYPAEIRAIVGLDPCTPETIDLIPKPKRMQLYTAYFLARVGLSRFMPESEVRENLPLLDSNELSDGDKKQYLAGFYRSAVTRDMLREIECLEHNAKSVAANGTPIGTPMFFFISDDQDENAPGWKEALSNYLAGISIGHHMYLKTGHYVHHHKADQIAYAAKEFLRELG
ncbi:MAG: alpha/beta hydrolase [Bacillota bacterium]